MASSLVIGLVIMGMLGAGSFGTMAVMNSDWGMMDHHEGMHDGNGDTWEPHHMDEECEEHHEDYDHHEEHEAHEDDEYYTEEHCHHDD